MIKLNNKNITYVALADTNNSLKAPKEIWYADSNNSVKLVYRRKDALIEGVDYEKYHWLVGEGSGAYIQGISYDLWDNHLEVEIGKLSNSLQSRYIGYPNFSIVFNVTGQAFQVIFRQNDSGYPHIADIYPYSSMPDVITMDFYIENSLFYCNQNGVVKTNDPAQTAIESTWKSVTPQIYSAKMSYIREVLPNDTYRSNLIPCKLLKSLPKWLDANGIRRNIGECGMIDLVSGKFYGNVNSVGTFTVENYYERKEWLKVQTTTQTGTYLTLSLGTSMNFSFKRVWLSDFFNTWYFSTPGYVYYTDNHRLVSIWDSTNSTGVNSGDTSTINVGDTITIESTPNLLLINGKTINRYNYVSGVVSLTNAVARKITSLTSSITVDGAERYIPCTLTMDLPASMDANNIARTKGTSGMWDLVSDRFYGNVANSGTFKAVNLAEGVDYEVHQWLVGDKSAYMFIGEYSERVKFKVKLTSPSVDFGFIYGWNGALRTYGNNNSFTANITENIISRVQLPSTKEILIDFSEHLVYADDVQIAYTNKGSESNDESAFKKAYFWGFELLQSRRSDCSIGTIYADNQVFVPVKLLKSIPSTYDANGIARQAGECGMYDTVNDVFYGNLASSGTFSVEDDN